MPTTDPLPPSEGLHGVALPGSLAKNSSFRLSADVGQLIVGVIAAVITARALGPAGKGALSSLLLIGVLLSYICTAGLDDAAIVLFRQGKTPLHDAYVVSAGPILVLALVTMPLLWLAAAIADWSQIRDAVVAASVLLPLATLLRLALAVENATERFGFSSAVLFVIAAVTTMGDFFFIVLLGLGVGGGVVAGLVGTAAGLVIVLNDLTKRGMPPRLRWDPAFLRRALTYGLPAQAAFLLVALSQRLDVLLVYAVAGEAPAGRYAVATSFAQLVWYAPFALATAGFPRLASLQEEEADALVARMSSMTLTSALLSAVLLFAIVPLGLPLLFGPSFAQAVVPALVLVLGGIVWSEQWLLARAAAARGDAGHYLLSFAVSVCVMVMTDLVLIPLRGLTGAALGFGIGASCGTVLSASFFVRRRGWRWMKQLLPSSNDVKMLFSYGVTAFQRITNNRQNMVVSAHPDEDDR